MSILCVRLILVAVGTLTLLACSNQQPYRLGLPPDYMKRQIAREITMTCSTEPSGDRCNQAMTLGYKLSVQHPWLKANQQTQLTPYSP